MNSETNKLGKLQVLKPVEISKEELQKKYQRVGEIFALFPRGGGGVIQVTAKKTSDGWIVRCAVVQRDLVNHKGEPLPDGGMYDEEATKGLDDVVCHNREIELSGFPLAPDPIVAKIISEREIGFVTRERRGKEDDFSIETVMAIYTPGEWQEAKDIQYRRQVILVEIDPTEKMTYCNFGQSKMEMSRLPVDICTEKILLAARIGSDIGKVLNQQHK